MEPENSAAAPAALVPSATAAAAHAATAAIAATAAGATGATFSADVAPVPEPALVRLRKAQDRSFDREGIPMFLALTRTARQTPSAAQHSVRTEGTQLATELAVLRHELFPTRRADDLGCLISTVQALTVGTFEPELAL